MVKKRIMIWLVAALLLVLAAFAVLMFTGRYDKPPLSDRAKFVCALLYSA